MPAALTYPGVYIEEIPSGVHTIVGVATSNTAFVDWFPQGPVMQATRVTSFSDFTKRFGGLHPSSDASYAIQQYYLNGGQIAWVVRVTAGAMPATLALAGAGGAASFTVDASSPGSWGDNVQVAVTVPAVNPNNIFNLQVRRIRPGARPTDSPLASESFLNLSINPRDPNYAVHVVNAGSALVRLTDPGMAAQPPAPAVAPTPTPVDAQGRLQWQPLAGGADGDVPPTGDGVAVPGSNWAATGEAALLAAVSDPSPLDRIAPEIFNIVSIPAATKLGDAAAGAIYTAAIQYCEKKRAFAIIDLPDTVQLAGISAWLDAQNLRFSPNGAVYFPNLLITDQLAMGRDRRIGPSGTMAGVYARTDTNRGVWKAPAGVETVLVGARLPEKLVDDEIGEINPEGINALRAFPIIGNVCWGARTLFGADQQASEWKYIPIRRLALFLEESLYEGTKWVVFEPNDEPLWASIRLNVGAFMHHLFTQGAFQGQTPKDAYFVKCDAETTTQDDRNRGVVNILVGFAPLKPAEFVVIQIQQIAGAIQT